MRNVSELIRNEKLEEVEQALIEDEIRYYSNLIKLDPNQYIRYFNYDYLGKCKLKFQIKGLIDLYLEREGLNITIEGKEIHLHELAFQRIDEINEFLMINMEERRESILKKILNHYK